MATARTTPTLEQLHRAVAIAEDIQKLQRELDTLLGSHPSSAHSASAPAVGRPAGRRRKMSAAAKARIGAASRARWAKIKKGAATASAAKPKAQPAKKRTMSAATRAKLAAAARQRWAEKKKQEQAGAGATTA